MTPHVPSTESPPTAAGHPGGRRRGRLSRLHRRRVRRRPRAPPARVPLDPLQVPLARGHLLRRRLRPHLPLHAARVGACTPPPPELQVTRQSPIQLQLDQNVLRDDDSDRTVNGSSSFLATQVAGAQEPRPRGARDPPARAGTERRLPPPERRAAGPRRRRRRAPRAAPTARPRASSGTAREGEDTSSTDDVPPELLDRYTR